VVEGTEPVLRTGFLQNVVEAIVDVAGNGTGTFTVKDSLPADVV